ncbi:MAG: hypothetical protein ABIQ30_07480, partial [Devosia sp.]
KTLGNKLDRQYHALPHVAGTPFCLAVADFHAPGSMVWSREGLIGYLYGMGAAEVEVNGIKRAVPTEITRLLGPSDFPAGLFGNREHRELSAVVFSNACSIAKFNRVGTSGGLAPEGLRYTRLGQLFDRRPGALRGIPFCLDITTPEYRALWPHGYEPWSAELEVFHNPYARHKLPFDLVPEAQHWFRSESGELICRAFYETSILWSQTVIQGATDPVLTVEALSKVGPADPDT